MDPEDVEFLAEKQLITIVPNIDTAVFHFISGDTGPLKGGLACKVPLWLGVSLKQQQKCVILPPSWLNIDELQALLSTEKSSRNFMPPPSDHYMIEAKLILGCASDDIEYADEIKTLVKDLWDIRMSKLRTSIDTLVRAGRSHAALDNLTMLEINAARPLLPHALDSVYRIRASKNGAIRSQHTQSTSLNTSAFSGSAVNHDGSPV